MVLTAAGSDCSAGAGIQADLKTFGALGVHGLSVVSAVVAETPHAVSIIHPVPVGVFREQLDLLLGTYPVSAMKTGMLPGPEYVEILAGFDLPVNLVIDPVLVASCGTALGGTGLMQALCELLFPRAALVTPNMNEAAAILGREVHDGQAMEQAGRSMADRFGCAVLVTGGHLPAGQGADDFLALPGGTGKWLRGPRLENVEAVSHGTGCTLSAAIAAGLASGKNLENALSRARAYLVAGLRHGNLWSSPRGGDIGAIDHGPFDM